VKSILFIGRANHFRSQMAAGLLEHLQGHFFSVQSAGLAPAPRIHPLAIAALAEVGIDISKNKPRRLDEIDTLAFDEVISLAEPESLVAFRFKKLISWQIPEVELGLSSSEDEMRKSRKIRDKIRAQVVLLGSPQPW